MQYGRPVGRVVSRGQKARVSLAFAQEQPEQVAAQYAKPQPQAHARRCFPSYDTSRSVGC